jgi:hypothetical protein
MPVSDAPLIVQFWEIAHEELYAARPWLDPRNNGKAPKACVFQPSRQQSNPCFWFNYEYFLFALRIICSPCLI